MSERYQLLVHLKMNAHHLLILINFISRTENKLFWKMLQCFFVCKQWKSLELNVVFGPHWLSLYGQKQLKHSSIYLLLSSTEKESHSGLEQHESVPMTEFFVYRFNQSLLFFPFNLTILYGGTLETSVSSHVLFSFLWSETQLVWLVAQEQGKETECSIMLANNFFVSHRVPEQITGVVSNDW